MSDQSDPSPGYLEECHYSLLLEGKRRDNFMYISLSVSP